MENKLELKHLAAYLPYKTKVQRNNFEKSIIELTIENLQMILSNSDKLVLRPLSDLTKEIEVNSARFIPMLKLAEIGITDNEGITFLCENNFISNFGFARYGIKILVHNELNYFNFMTEEISFYYENQHGQHDSIDNQYQLFQKLLEWHFDIFGLIEKGLAVDYNTINQ